MIREAELFVMAEGILVEVLGRIRTDDWRTLMPPLFPAGPRRQATIRQHVRTYVQDDARLPDLLAGCILDEDDADLLGPDPQDAVVRYSTAACAAVRKVDDGTAPAGDGSGSVEDLLWRSNIARCFLAHDVAMHLGSRACPFTEELARGMWEGTWPVAAKWRERGVFGEPLPLPDDVSWRDRFLLCAGRDPHPRHH